MFHRINIILVVLLFGCSTLWPQGDQYQLLLEEAKKDNKALLVEAMSPNCHFCKRMEQDVFSQKNIQEKIKKDYIFIVVNIEEDKLPYGLDKNYTGFTPYFFILDSSGKLMKKYPGAWTKEDFIEILNENR